MSGHGLFRDRSSWLNGCICDLHCANSIIAVGATCMYNCATNHACASKSNKVGPYSCLVALMFSPTSSPNPAPLFPTTKAPRRDDHRHPRVQSSAASYIRLPRLKSRPISGCKHGSDPFRLILLYAEIQKWFNAHFRHARLAVWRVRMLHPSCRLGLAAIGIPKWPELETVLSGRFCGRSYVWLVPEWYLIDQAN
jgi:hypothetical protein